MKTSFILKMAGVAGAIFMASACASNSTGPDVAATGNSDPGVDTRGSVVAGSQEDLEQNVGHRVFYGYDEYTLTAQAQATLARQADFLKQYPATKILIGGNCDERGTREYNLALGARRAEAARAYLVSMGIDAARISTVSYGKERPIDPASNEAAWSMNRNATTMITGVGA